MLVLSRSDLEHLLTPGRVIRALEDAFAQYARGQAQVPARLAMTTTAGGLLLLMPSSLGLRALGTKLVSVYGSNRERGLPTIFATYVLLEPGTGRPLAVLEGGFLTAIRTGATSALAARYLARADSRVVACFGAGVQAAFQLRCLASVFAIGRVWLVGRSRDRAKAFAEAMAAELGAPVKLADTPREAVSQADLVTCATTSSTPVFTGKDLRPGTHVDAVGAFRPDTREVDTDTVCRARIVVDSYASAMEEAGDLLTPIKEGAIDRSSVTAELAELVTGSKPGRRSRAEITLFKSVGFALEDAAAARLAYDEARKAGVGVEVELG
ncbi:MAG: ornithine cyclodeaminase family protein [Candidatus Rokubacteria bacterium]|nr:ornithine cyclodeaminase family protein [Candidatus Rokubacteria bacterium]